MMWVHQNRCYPNQEILGVHDKEEQGKTTEELSEAGKVPIEHMFNSIDNCSAEWCFKTRESGEVKTYNKKDNKLLCKQNDNYLYNLLKKTILTFQTDKILKKSLHIFDTQKNSMKKQCDSIRCSKKQDNGAQHEP